MSEKWIIETEQTSPNFWVIDGVDGEYSFPFYDYDDAEVLVELLNRYHKKETNK